MSDPNSLALAPDLRLGAPQRPRVGAATPLFVLALLTAVGPISTDMYLPAFPAMREALHGGNGATQVTLAAWFLGLAIGQVVHGPVSDHYGRRPPLLVGTLIYTLASVGCALAPDMTVLSLFRAVAAFGGAAGLVVPRAMVRDMVTDGAEAARMVSRLTLVMGVVPVLAPTLGGILVQSTGWRSIFWAAAGYGALCAALVAWMLPETRPHTRRVPLRLAHVLLRYLKVTSSREFGVSAMVGGFATFSLFAFLGGAPPVLLVGFHLSPTAFGSVFILNAGGYVAGTQLNARAVPRLGGARVLRGACLGLLAASAAMLVLAVLRLGGAWGVVLPMAACMACLGFVLPGAAIGAVLPHARDAGSASALYGTVVFSVGAVSTVLVGLMADTTAVSMALLMVTGALAALVVVRL